ncbi:MAG: glycosyltransferase family 4 protein [Gemmatimonadaceae bacterium]|nr:glycosyltransferase family 4 protein [Gemmatimonadaceae bacterium]
MSTAALICPDGLSVSLFCKGIIRELRSAGWNRVLVLTEVGSYREDIESLGAECVDVPVARFIDIVGDIRYTLTLARILRSEHVEGVLAFSTKPNVFGAFAAKLAGSHHIVTHVVGMGSVFVPQMSLPAKVMRGVMRALYRMSSRIADHVWFTNPGDRDFFVLSGIVEEEKAILSRNYLDTQYYMAGSESLESVQELRRELGIAADATVVVMVARLIWPKGIGEFAGAAEILREKCPRCFFILVAPEEPPSPHTVPVATVRSYEKLGNFKWLGFRKDVRRLYALCDVAVLPTYYKEGGYPRALLEPMSMGKPLVASTSEDCRATVDEGLNGFLVPPRDAEALASAILKLAENPELRQQYGAHSRQKAVGEFDEKVILRKMISQAGLVPDSIA